MTPEEKKTLFDEAVGKITMGFEIEITDASYSANSVCLGDFRDMGWSERIATRSSLYYKWKGPSAIWVMGNRIEPNQYTEEVDMDWT